MIYFLVALICFIIYSLVVDWLRFKGKSERASYEVDKYNYLIEKEPSNPMYYCKRGTAYQIKQNFINANLDFRKALELIEEGSPVETKDMIIGKLKMNIAYTAKPLSWSKNGPKDHSKNFLMYSLIDRLGNMRYNF